MADVRLNIANREYIVTCRDGEEARLETLGSIVADMVKEAGGSAGGLNESRQLLFAALLLADKLHDSEAKSAPAAAMAQSNMVGDEHLDLMAQTIEKLTERLKRIVDTLE